jgi:hypothetical protein
MEARPRPHEPQRTWWKRPFEDSQRGDLDLSDLIAVLGVEVRRRMVGTVHPYDDSVERGQARHRAIVGYNATDMVDGPIKRGRHFEGSFQTPTSDPELKKAILGAEAQTFRYPPTPLHC